MNTHINIKKVFKLLLIVSGILFLNSARSQNYMGLQKLNEHQIQVYFSAGHEQRAKDIAARTENAIRFTQELLAFKPEIMLLVLTPEDWKEHTDFPVYGMPHLKADKKTLVVASSDNEFWRSFIPPVDQLPANLAGQVGKAYGKAGGNLTMQPFFDLLALHELGHAFHSQGGLNMQRKWMGELFCNILLHTYIAEKEPEQLLALTVFPNMVVNSGTSEYSFTTLNEIEKNYELIAMQHPKNYGWYQSRWHVAAHNIYDKGGKDVLMKLWNTLKRVQTPLTDDDFASALKTRVDDSVADLLLNWDATIKK